MNLRFVSSAAALLVASQSLTGCFLLWRRDTPDDPPPLVPPTEERVTLRYTASRGCGPFSGDSCTTDRALMAGVRERMEVRLSSNPSGDDPTVTSSDPSVVRVGPVQRIADDDGFVGGFDVVAGERAGEAVVTLTQGDGRETSFPVRVAEAAGLDIVEDEGTAGYDRARDRVTVRVGQRVSMNGYPVGLDGRRLLANDGVVWTVPDTRRVGLSWSYMNGPRVADDHVYFVGASPGTEVVTVRAGVVERTLIVEVR